MRMQASWVRMVMDCMSEADLLREERTAWIFLAASMAVWEWNSAKTGETVVSAGLDGGEGGRGGIYRDRRL